MEHQPGASGWYNRRPLDPPDAIESAARMHFVGLHQKVFEPLGVGSKLELLYSNPRGPHGRVLTELFALADSSKEGSVVFGLVYALLSLPWKRHVLPGYYDYLSLMRTLDESDVVVRALAATSSRLVELRPQVRERLLLLVGDMVEADWPKAVSVLLALQRAAPPGKPGVAQLISSLLSCIAQVSWILDDATKLHAAKLTLLWMIRWTAFVEQLGDEDDVKALRKQLVEAIRLLATKETLKGEALHWAQVASCRVPELEFLRCSFDSEAAAPCSKEDYGHLLTAAETQQISYLLKATPEQEARMLPLFFRRNIESQGRGQDVHLADVILFAITVASSNKVKKPLLWREFWERSSGQTQAMLAFCFSARKSDYGRSAFAEALGGQGHETVQQLVSLSDPLLHPFLNRCLEIIGKKSQACATTYHPMPTGGQRGMHGIWSQLSSGSSIDDGTQVIS
eukprot:Skav218423  [mRNA]  locus=scaffold420:16692:18053:- [translate_table: standard]